MNKERALYLVTLLAVLGVVGGVYQFYFKAKLEKYGADKKLLESLQETHKGLKTTFGDADPDDVITAWEGQVEAWNDAVNARMPFFSDDTWREHKKPPEGERILQFWYGDESVAMVTALAQKAQEKYANEMWQRMPDGFPNNVQQNLYVTSAADWKGREISAELVNDQLERLSYGISAYELMMDNDVRQLSYLQVTPIGSSGFIGKGVDYHRIGLSFQMQMDELVKFIEKLRSSKDYYSIEGLKITYPYIALQYEPQLQIDMYLSRTQTKVDKKAAAAKPADAPKTDAASAYGSNFGEPANGAADSEATTAPATRKLPGQEDEEQGRIKSAWKWFLRTVFLIK